MAEVIEDIENFYSVFSAVERFLYLSDFLNYIGLMDLLLKIERDP